MSGAGRIFRVERRGVETAITFVENEGLDGGGADPERGLFATLEDAKAAAREHLEEQQTLIADRLSALDELDETDVAEDEAPAEEESYGGAYHVIYEDVDTRIQFWDDSEPMGAADFETFATAKQSALDYLRWCLEEGAFHEEIKEELPGAIARIEALEESDVAAE